MIEFICWIVLTILGVIALILGVMLGDGWGILLGFAGLGIVLLGSWGIDTSAREMAGIK